jgi:hypothetical protein
MEPILEPGFAVDEADIIGPFLADPTGWVACVT